MMIRYLLLLFLPAVAYSDINIMITPGETVADASVKFSGSNVAVLSDKERTAFKLDDETLKRAIGKIMGRRCHDVFLKPSTPWGDVFKKFNWNVTERIAKPVKASIIGITSKPVVVASAEYVNNHHSVNVTYSTSVTQQVQETVGHTWSSGGELSIGQVIKYEVNFGAGTVGGSTSLSYTSKWGEDTSKAKTITLGTTSTVLTVVPPGGKVVAMLTASQGTLDIEVIYEVSLTNGKVFCSYYEYKNIFEPPQFFVVPLSRVQSEEKLPFSFTYTEKISVGFYTRERIEVTNGTLLAEDDEKQHGVIKTV